jgi:hypothetical protein
MADGVTIENREFWPVILYRSSRLYLHSLDRVADSIAKTLDQLFEREIGAPRNRNICVVAASTDNASNLIKTLRGNLTPDYSFPG